MRTFVMDAGKFIWLRQGYAGGESVWHIVISFPSPALRLEGNVYNKFHLLTSHTFQYPRNHYSRRIIYR